jgi:starch synthase
LPKNDLVNLLTSATVFVCPSIYEPLGIVNLEAMACETAVVASNVGGIPEVVKNNETGILIDFQEDSSTYEFKLAEAITRVLSDKTLAHELGVAGRKRAVAEFGWDKVVAETLKLYRSLNV